MIIKSVGKNLKLWPPEAAALRAKFESDYSKNLESLGFARIYTQHVVDEVIFEDLNVFATVLRQVALRVRKPEPNANALELKQYAEQKTLVFLAPKHAQHILVCSHGVLSYRDLPRRVYEVSEIYHNEDAGLTNDAGFYLTTLCLEADLEEETRIMNKILLNPPSKDFSVSVGVVRFLPNQTPLSFVGPNNTKVSPFVLCGYCLFGEKS